MLQRNTELNQMVLMKGLSPSDLVSLKWVRRNLSNGLSLLFWNFRNILYFNLATLQGTCPSLRSFLLSYRKNILPSGHIV